MISLTIPRSTCAVAPDFIGGDVHLNEVCGRRENFTEDIEETQAATEKENQIGSS
ncbi:MAG: hypothetical protein MZV70_72245 [Desulfobacterales bacterium]|nr:hypothetical protein [Desulfobacterales bacterium]